MKQYQISFYYARTTAKPTVYYREFESITELNDWTTSLLIDCPWFTRFEYKVIPVHQFLEHTN